MSDLKKTAMEKLASDPRAVKAGKMIEKIGYNMYMAEVRQKMAHRNGVTAPNGDIEKLAQVAIAIKETPNQVSEEVKNAFVEKVMSNPSLGQEVKEAMTRKEMYKNAYRQRIHGNMLYKRAEEIALADTPQGEEIDPEMIEAIIEILVEEEEGLGGEDKLNEDELLEEDFSNEDIAQALEDSGLPLEEGEPPEKVAAKVAELAQRHLDAGHEKTASVLYYKYIQPLEMAQRR